MNEPRERADGVVTGVTRDGEVVPAGYKRTSAGVLPVDWDVARIDTHATITTGSRNTEDKQDDGEYPFFVRSQEVEFIDTYSYDGEAVLTAGDGVGTGKVFHYIVGRFDVHQRVYRIANFSDQLNGRYFFYVFSTSFYERIMSMTAKSSVDSVRMEMIAGMTIPIPRIEEQRAISEALSDVDGVLKALDALIAKKRAIKQATMQRLLTGRIRLPGFTGEWQTTSLERIGIFFKGRGIKREDVSSEGYPSVRYGELYTRYEDYVSDLQARIPRDVASRSFPIRTGDLLFAGSGETADEIGRCAAYLGRSLAYAGGDIIILRPNRQNSIYLGCLMNLPIVVIQKARMAQGDAVVHISASNLRKVQIDLPPVPEQDAITTTLTDMNTELATLQRRRKKILTIKQGMVQQLLTGRMRLVDPCLSARMDP